MAAIRARRSTGQLVSIAVGIVFTIGIYYTMHYRMGWDWDAPGTGQLPRAVVEDFLYQSYNEGQGADARRDYFAPELGEEAARPQELSNGTPIAHEIHQMVGQGLTVVVFHTIPEARGVGSTNAIDLFEVRNGRIVSRERYDAELDTRAYDLSVGGK